MSKDGAYSFTSREELINSLNALTTERKVLLGQRDALQARMTELVLEHQQKQRYGSRANRQRMMMNWAVRMFGPDTRMIRERATRVAEEAIELAQAGGVTDKVLTDLILRVYSKQPGTMDEEIGGTMVTLLVLSEALGLDADTVERNEIERVMAKDERAVRSSQQSKHITGLGEPVPLEMLRDSGQAP